MHRRSDGEPVSVIDRRAILGLAGASLPALAVHRAGAQVTPPPVVPPPAPVDAAPPTPAAPVAIPPPAAAVVHPAPAITTSPAAGAIDRTKSYYVFYDQTIDVASMRALRRQLAILVEAGVTDITLVIHSPGGFIDPTYAMYSFIRALPARIQTHASSFVMSAACILFLAGENRSADRNARFLFHPTQGPISGSLTGQQIQDRLVQFQTNAAATAQIYHDRTTLSDTEIASFSHEEVFYTPEEAKARGIVQTIADLRIPGEGRARILFLD